MAIDKRIPGSGPQAEGPLSVVNVSRRGFVGGVAGLVLGLYLAPLTARAADAVSGAAAKVDPSPFLRIDRDGIVTVIAKHLEMGQGTYTGLATLVAEELDADWQRVRVEGAPADARVYANLAMGMQGTGGSTAIANSYRQMRTVGATARAMLVAAAAREWEVPAAEISVSRGVLTHTGSGREAGFGEFAEAAAGLPVPERVSLKDPADFSLIGSLNTPRPDSAAKTDGSAIFTQDVRLPGMLVAMAAHPPRFGATVKRYNAERARRVPGVEAIVQFEAGPHVFAGVAVLASNTWAARTARDALEVEWDESQAFRLGSDEIKARYRELAAQDGLVASARGQVERALADAAVIIEADYEFPYLAHAAMEPLNCLVQLEGQHCHIWNGEQWQTPDQGAVAALLGIPMENVNITQLYAGGSFGRRANPHSDFVLEAVAIARSAREQGITVPIKLVWSREDDTRGGYYRPMNLHRGRLALDADGRLMGWHQRLVGQSIMQGTPMAQFMVKNGVDASSVEGAANLAYGVPNLQVELQTPEDIRVPVQWWRSVGHTHTAFSTECLVDEVAVAAGRDPVEYRLELLADKPRHRGVLELAAARSGWAEPLSAGKAGQRRGRGVAVHESFSSFVAEVAEVTAEPDGSFHVDRVVCAVDCGVAVNPDVIKAQMEGGIGFGLAAALHGEITLEDGVVQQSNYHDFPVLRINEMPAVEVHIVASAESPTGVGEPGVPPIAPAVANAIFAATGQRLRSMPFDRSKLAVKDADA